MAAHSTKTRQTKLIAALLDPANTSQGAACAAAGVPVRTLQNWLLDDDFQDVLRTAESQLVDHAARRLLALTDGAIAALAEELKPYSKPQHSLRAAELVLSHVLKWRELGELEDRIAALETKLQ